MSKSYIAKFEGKVVGKRTTKGRTYTHAIVIIPSREYARKVAYEYRATSSDKSNYNWYVERAEGRSIYKITPEQQIEASTKVDGGFTAFVERLRQERIARFEQQTFEPSVATWCGRADLAQKAARQFQQPWNETVMIVEAEEVVRPSNKRTADALNASLGNTGFGKAFKFVP